MTAADNLALVARAIGGLVVVLVLVAISARIARRSKHFGTGQDLQVLERRGLSRESQLVVVQVSGHRLLLGVGPQGVSLLHRLDAVPEPPETPDQDPVDDAGAPPARGLGTGRHVAGPHPGAPATAPAPAPAAVPAPAVKPPPTVTRVPAPEPDPDEFTLPGTVQVDSFPDLASALRAAGRTVDDAPAGQPLTRAQARAAATDRPVPRQRTTGSASGRPATAGGSVLNPATWKQGLEALRELTVRRG